VDDEHGFIKYFKSLPAIDGDNETIRIFDRGDWYTAHGENANFIARTVCPVATKLGLGSRS
jgi:DNA mismatch repair protein MSH2